MLKLSLHSVQRAADWCIKIYNVQNVGFFGFFAIATVKQLINYSKTANNRLTREQLIAALNFFLLFTIFTFRWRRFNPKWKHETVFGNVFCRSARSLYRLIIKTLKGLFFLTCSGLNNNKYSSHVKSYCLSSNHYSAIQALRQLITELYHAGAQWMQ